MHSGERVQGRAQKVALTVDADDATFAAIVDALEARHAATARQGDAGAGFRMRARFGLPVMKALPVETATDLAADPAYRDVANWLLFDARAAARGHPAGWARPAVRLDTC